MLFVQFLDKVVDMPVLVQIVGGRQKTVEVPQLLSDGVREQFLALCHRSWRKSSSSSASSWTRLWRCPLLRRQGGRRPCYAGRCVDKVVDVPVGVQRQVPWGSECRKLWRLRSCSTLTRWSLSLVCWFRSWSSSTKVLTVPVDNFLLWRLWRVFARFTGIFRAPSIRTLSAR